MWSDDGTLLDTARRQLALNHSSSHYKTLFDGVVAGEFTPSNQLKSRTRRQNPPQVSP
ncbi:hypothetical protein OH492_14020 [Vibrio chagasii]|nr:hypothetical protein [Vibrio chagasii]